MIRPILRYGERPLHQPAAEVTVFSGEPGDVCSTTNIAAGRFAGSCATSRVNAVTPPLDAPTQMTSRATDSLFATRSS